MDTAEPCAVVSLNLFDAHTLEPPDDRQIAHERLGIGDEGRGHVVGILVDELVGHVAGVFRNLAQFDQPVGRRVFLAGFAVDRDRAALLLRGDGMPHGQLADLAGFG